MHFGRDNGSTETKVPTLGQEFFLIIMRLSGLDWAGLGANES